MNVHADYSISKLNTFGVDIKAKYFVEISKEQDLVDFLGDENLRSLPMFILGGGSNTLFINDFDGVILRINLLGKEIISEDEDTLIVEVGAGEDWPQFVNWVVEQGLSGVENLAYMPGTVGAAPVQNIAAYGQTQADTFVSVEAMSLKDGSKKIFTKDQCKFEYRSSIFKRELAGDYIITKVRFELSKDPQFDTNYHSRYSYESLQKWLTESATPPYKPKDVANAVTKLRQFKLPDVKDWGCCGSFFLNPFVTVEKFKELQEKIDELQFYPVTEMEYDRIDWHDTGKEQIVKIPAGRLLDELGWKGKWIGNVGTFERHALCVITKKEASGKEILDYTEAMKKSVMDAYGVELISEVRVVKS
jgi:UDP-N-acetylmuramate dehydrogenase